MSENIEQKSRLTLSMCVKNEEKRYLERVLMAAKEYITDAVIIDDGSTDNTVNICKEILKDIPHKIIENKDSIFKNEWVLRQQQWKETIMTNPDWILSLDADEILEDKFKLYADKLMSDPTCYAYLFRLYDFWDENHYRDDSLWQAHRHYRAFMIRYKKDFLYQFKKTDQHCGRLPSNVLDLKYYCCSIRLKHMGWARQEDRIEKYNRYMELDPNGKNGSLAQYYSILDEKPNLVLWQED